MAQLRVNGASAADQFLSGELKHFILDAVDAVDVHQFGFTAAGNPKGGEAALSALAVVANPVIMNKHGSNTRILYFAVEVDGISNSALQTALRANSTFANATVTAGSYSVV